MTLLWRHDVSTEESKERFGYCDLHLESTLLPRGSWIVGKSGGDKADCNPLECWRCSVRTVLAATTSRLAISAWTVIGAMGCR
jgi:hypothetical protein